MSANKHLAPGVDTTLLKTHFSVVTDSVGALIFPVKSNKFLPTVNLGCSFSSFSGFTLHTILPYVTFLSWGIWDLGTKMTLFVPFTPHIPWANCPNSFAKDLSQKILSEPLIRCLYSWETPEIYGYLHWLHGFFWNFLSMHKVTWYFSCILISSYNLALPCPPLEVAQYSPLVVGQVPQGKYCLDLMGKCGPCAKNL